jgi:ATP-dependent DNA ligase
MHCGMSPVLCTLQHACEMGLEGIVSKRIDAPYRSGNVKTWLKIKNPNALGTLRFKEDQLSGERIPTS